MLGLWVGIFAWDYGELEVLVEIVDRRDGGLYECAWLCRLSSFGRAADS